MKRLLILMALELVAQDRRALRMTDIQVIGTHNSYHVGMGEKELAALRRSNERVAESLAYRHPPLRQQLDAGVRQFELDVFGDAKGGLFAQPRLLLDGNFDSEGKLSKPGFKVLHVQDLDFRSSCLTLVDCLTQIRDWSRAHPRHLPIAILIENKDGRPRPEFMVEPETITPETLKAIDHEILQVFRREELITPDLVRAGAKTLSEAVLKNGWPELEKARGKLLFMLDQERVTKFYTEGAPSLEGRIMFTNAEPGAPDAAFIKVNNAEDPRIPELVKQGYLVRTMVDGAKDGTRRDQGMASGAQLLSTDYPFDWKAANGYSVRFDRGIARCNPVTLSVCDPKSLRE